MKPNLAEELVLLALEPGGRVQLDVDYGLAGALLVELVMAGRVQVSGDRVTVVDSSPTGDPVVDHALGQVAAGKPGSPPKDWISPLSSGLRYRVLDRLVELGVLWRTEEKVLWIFRTVRYPSATGAEPAAAGEVRARLRSVMDSSQPADPRTGALCALIHVLEMERLAVPDRPNQEVRSRLRAVADASWPADAVKKAIDEVQVAVTMAVTAATTVTVVAGGR